MRPSALPLAAAMCAMLAGGCRSQAEKDRCAAEVKELREWMRDVAAEGYGSEAARGPAPQKKPVALAVVEEREPVSAVVAGPTLVLDGTAMYLDGTPAGDTSKPLEAAARLRRVRLEKASLWTKGHPGKTSADDTAFVAAFARTDRWSEVAAALDDAARAGYVRAGFVFEVRTKAPPPPDSAASRALAARSTSGQIDPARKAPPEGATPSVSERCPELGESVASLSGASATPDEKAASLAQAVADGVDQCNCKADTGEVKATFWAMLGRYDGPPAAHYTVQIAPTGEPGVTEIAASPTDTWANVTARVIAAGKQRVSFAAR